jgi:hypothetical protein
MTIAFQGTAQAFEGVATRARVCCW